MNSNHFRITFCMLLAGLILAVSPGAALSQTSPETTLTSFPLSLGAARLSASTFTFTSNIVGSTFECSLDNSDFTPCTSPVSYANLASGRHSFQVQAVAPDGTRDQTPASRDWAVSAYNQWSSERLQNIYAKSSAIALDTAGNPHIAFVGISELTYTAWNPVANVWNLIQWPIRTLGEELSLALDAHGRPHIVYYTTSGSSGFGLKYLYWDGTTWITEMVDAGVWGGDPYIIKNTGLFNSLALDQNGNPHISYYNYTEYDTNPDNSGVRYASRVGSTWVVQSVANGTQGQAPTRGTSLALDSSGHPIIAYRSVPDNDLTLARYDGASWTFETVDSFYDAGHFTALKLDPLGRPHLAYLTKKSETSAALELDYAVWDGATWNRQVAVQSWVPESVALLDAMALDAAGYPHIAYRDWSARPMYATWDGVQWMTHAIPSDRDYSQASLSLAVDSSGRAHISQGSPTMNYYVVEKATAGKLRATIELAGSSYPKDAQVEVCLSGGTIDLSGVTPNCKTAAGNGAVVEWQELLPGSDYVVNVPEAADWTKPASQSGLAVTTGETTSVALAFTYTGSALPDTLLTGHPQFDRLSRGSSASFHFDSTQTDSTFECQIDSGIWEACASPKAYANLADGTHSFAVRARNARGGIDPEPRQFDWPIDQAAAFQLSESTAWAGEATQISMALDSNGFPIIASAATTGPTYLRVARWNGLSWETYPVPGGGLSPSLVLDHEGHIHIAYHANGIRYAVWDGVQWNVQLAASSAGNPIPILQLDANDVPHILYADSDKLNYVTRDFNDWRPDTWKKESIPNTTVKWVISSLLHTSGDFHVVYQDWSNLYALDRVGGVWGIPAVINTGHSVYEPSSAVWGPDGEVYAAYRGEVWDAATNSYIKSLYYAAPAGSGWNSEVVFSSSMYTALDLDLDSAGHPHIAYVLRSGTIQLATKTGAGWEFQDVASMEPHSYQDVALLLDAQDRPHVAYSNWLGWSGSGLYYGPVFYALGGTVLGATPPAITTDPESQAVYAGDAVSFNAAASGEPTPTLQWQVSADNGATWTDIAGGTASPLAFTASLDQNGHQYRAVFTNSAGSATSNAATLTVLNVLPQPHIGSLSPASAVAESGNLSLIVSGNGFVDGSVVRWNGDSLETTFDNATRLRAIVPAASLATVNTAQVTVFTAGGGTSNVLAFFVTQAPVEVTGQDVASGTDPSVASGPATATATGDGLLAVAQYEANPGGTPSFTASGVYFDVYAAPGNTFTEVSIVACNLNGEDKLFWWDSETGNWVKASPQTYDSTTGCVTLTVDANSSPSLSQLSGTAFAAGTETVSNTAPVADPGGPYLGAINTAIAFDGSASSDVEGDALTYAWAFGDDVTGTGARPTHAYAATGIYNVCLTVNDGTADSAPVCTIVVVYDPSAGFVTGGGWILSPEGAYKLDESLSGKTTFGFVSKYKKGSSVPEGNTEFQFEAGGFKFHSTAYEWLVVNKSGTNAQFKGAGLVNGALAPNGSVYKFVLWAGDGTGPNGLDTFRIRIWWEDVDGVEHDVYDNGFDQEIGGGSIVIHTAKAKSASPEETDDVPEENLLYLPVVSTD